MATEILPLQEKLFAMVFRIKAAMPSKQFRQLMSFFPRSQTQMKK